MAPPLSVISFEDKFRWVRLVLGLIHSIP